MSQALLGEYEKKIESALGHLRYSHDSLANLELNDLSKLSEDELVSLEAFTSRFSRCVDLYLTKYIKLKIKMSDPAFDGSLLDFLNQAEKLNLLEDPSRFLSMRKLRNQQAHEYEDEDLLAFFKRVQRESEFLLDRLPKYLAK